MSELKQNITVSYGLKTDQANKMPKKAEDFIRIWKDEDATFVAVYNDNHTYSNFIKLEGTYESCQIVILLDEEPPSRELKHIPHQVYGITVYHGTTKTHMLFVESNNDGRYFYRFTDEDIGDRWDDIMSNWKCEDFDVYEKKLVLTQEEKESILWRKVDTIKLQAEIRLGYEDVDYLKMSRIVDKVDSIRKQKELRKMLDQKITLEEKVFSCLKKDIEKGLRSSKMAIDHQCYAFNAYYLLLQRANSITNNNGCKAIKDAAAEAWLQAQYGDDDAPANLELIIDIVEYNLELLESLVKKLAVDHLRPRLAYVKFPNCTMTDDRGDRVNSALYDIVAKIKKMDSNYTTFDWVIFLKLMENTAHNEKWVKAKMVEWQKELEDKKKKEEEERESKRQKTK